MAYFLLITFSTCPVGTLVKKIGRKKKNNKKKQNKCQKLHILIHNVYKIQIISAMNVRLSVSFLITLFQDVLIK
jgi:hypothetical protein